MSVETIPAPSASVTAVNLWSWYPVVASADLQPGAVMPAMLHGEPLVVWRSRDGRPGVWNDRCPHRGMSLSFGATIAGDLVCPYHGWAFGSDGRCHRIPAHPDLKPSPAVRARVYPVTEAHAYVWACIGEPETTMPEFGGVPVERLQPVRSVHVAVGADTAIRILLRRPLHTTLEQEVATAYRRDGSEVVAEYAGSGAASWCRVRPGLPVLRCQFEARPGPSGYVVMVQPTDENAAVIHVATIGDATQDVRLALNDALASRRSRMPHLAQQADSAELQSVFAALI